MAVTARSEKGKLAKKLSPRSPVVKGSSSFSEVAQDFNLFMDNWKQNRCLQLVEAIGKTAKVKTGKKVSVSLPKSALAGAGAASERSLMQALGWYWEPLLHDLAFFEEMRDSISLLDGSTQKFLNVALDGFELQCDDPDLQDEINDALLENPQVNLKETIRSAMIDLDSLGNCYKIPKWTRDDQGRLVPKTFKPVRANAMRKLRDEDLAIEGYVQLLHRPSEFLFGATPPQTPTLYTKDEVLCGTMRTFGWYAYGKPRFGSVPFIARLKLTMERDLAEMLHQHVPRIDIKFTPDEQMNDEQVQAAVTKTSQEVAALKPTDNYIHTPDTEIDYKGPAGKGLDFSMTQKHIEEQIFYVLPFAPAIMGRDSQANPYDSQQHWTIATDEAAYLRTSIETMFAPFLKMMGDDWGTTIKISWGQLDPDKSKNLAEAEEFHVNNAITKRDAGFIDQDTAAKHATAHQKGGPVKEAAAPGQLPPPVDPNQIDPKTGKPYPAANPTPAPKPGSSKTKDARKGPSGKKTPRSDTRPKGKRHGEFFSAVEEVRAALSRLQA